MKTILVIGIGAGNPEHITVQAVNALNRADVVFLLDKGPAKAKLNRLRREICERYIRHAHYRVVEVLSPERGPDAGDYPQAVRNLNRDKQQAFEQLFDEALQPGECGALLVWGDPALYDGTLRILQAILASGRQVFEYQVVPGITSVQALTAQHRVPLNAIGEGVLVTTGRRLAEGWPAGVSSVVVMLDAEQAFTTLVGQGEFHIYWGAYVGTPDELLLAGPLDEVAAEIVRVRSEARARHGWIMDTYLLQRLG